MIPKKIIWKAVSANSNKSEKEDIVGFSGRTNRRIFRIRPTKYNKPGMLNHAGGVIQETKYSLTSFLNPFTLPYTVERIRSLKDAKKVAEGIYSNFIKEMVREIKRPIKSV
jgi:predicted fused transcriptional regulator/phosphomethylpyrimidine kinase